ncbi:MAG: trimethylamine methyltransferase family protein [Deltaproteobacteria bacterium]|nr:trimethylamine methyltransferase family protein [Deltaproteobacteria bacterium]MBW2633761.1 trimethylamine methyltransferase family protein [Deltaproteobacteria bacterium]
MKRNLHAGKRLSGGLSLNILTDDELDEIHLATLEILEKTGLFVEDEEALAIFDGGGAFVDAKKKIVKFPSYVVEDCVRSAPSKVVLAGRDPQNDIVLESNRVGFTNFGEGVQLVDPVNGQLRQTTKSDVADSAKLVDYLSDVDVYERAVGAHDVPQEVGAIHCAEACLSNTTKHVLISPINGYQLEKIVAMATAIAGSKDKLQERPIVSLDTCPVSPLKLVRDCCEILIGSARHGILTMACSMAMAGGSSPVHLAGTLVIHNAEVLGGLMLTQLTRKGAPFMYGSSTTAMDLRLGTAVVGTPECAMINAAVARLARYYSLPCFVAGG